MAIVGDPFHQLDRIIADLEAGKKPDTVMKRAAFLRLVGEIYGVKKVQQVCSRYHISTSLKEDKPLKLGDVKKLQAGLSDITMKDLDKVLKKVRQGDPMSLREEEAVKSLDREELKKYRNASELPLTLFTPLLRAMQAPGASTGASSRYSSALDLKKITGIPGPFFSREYILYGLLSHEKGRSLEDAQRLKLYEELASLGPRDQTRYCELLSKILVKKHLYYEKKGSDELQLGMLVPGLPGPHGEERWYKVGELLDTGWGKFAYRLVPATMDYPADMPDLLLYRSTASLPTSMDQFPSVLSDANVFPPGYLFREQGKAQERAWLTHPTPAPGGGVRPLLITGHSLGASNCQLALMNLSKEEGATWPNRAVSLELFDSPAIARQDAEDFKKWFDAQGGEASLTFQYYVSKGDKVPLSGALSGSSYLGRDITKNGSSAIVHDMGLTQAGMKREELTGLGAHGRIYSRGVEGVDYQDRRVTIEQFDKENRYKRLAVTLATRAAALLVWATIGVGGGLKRFLFGRRHHDPVMLQLFRKAIERLKPKEVEKPKLPLEEQIEALVHQKERVELELMTMTLEKSGDIKKEIDEAIEGCKKLLKPLKLTDPERGKAVEKIAQELEKLLEQCADYAKRTELLPRYIALGINEALITEEEGFFLRRIAFKAEKQPHNPLIKITDSELGQAKHIQLKLIDALAYLERDRKGDYTDLQRILPTSEVKFVKMVIHAFLNHKKILPKDADRMEDIVSKLACRGIKEGTLLALLLNNPRSIKR